MKFALILILLLVGCSLDTPDAPLNDNPFDPANPETHGDPFKLQTRLEPGAIRVTWHKVVHPTITGYSVYRSVNDSSYARIRELSTADDTTFADRAIRNGNRYGYYVLARFGDREGAYSSRFTKAYVRTSPALFIEGETVTETPTRNVTLTVLAFEAERMLLSNSADFAGAVWEPFAPTKAWQLTTEAGTKRVYGRVTFAGDTSDVVEDEIEPAGPSISFTINGGASFTEQNSIILSISHQWATEMLVSNQVPISEGVWRPIIDSLRWELIEGNGLKTVYMKARGDFQVESFASDSIHLRILETLNLWRTLIGHSDDVHCVTFSPDGTILASASHDTSIKLWRVEDGALIRTLLAHTSTAFSVAFSPDGEILASTSQDHTVRLWRSNDGQQITTLTGHSAGIESVKFSPDGRILASGSTDRIIKLWDTSDWSLIRTISSEESNTHIWSVAFNPDGALLAGGSYNHTNINIWRTSDGSLFRTLIGHEGWVNSVEFSPDGEMLASGSTDRTVKLWCISNGTLIRTLFGHSGDVRPVTFSPDGMTIASSGNDQTIMIWRTSDGQLVDRLSGHTDGIWSVVFSPDGLILASGSADNTIKLWR